MTAEEIFKTMQDLIAEQFAIDAHFILCGRWCTPWRLCGAWRLHRTSEPSGRRNRKMKNMPI